MSNLDDDAIEQVERVYDEVARAENYFRSNTHKGAHYLIVARVLCDARMSLSRFLNQ